MINTLLEATKIEAGASQIDVATVNLCDFFEELKANYEIPLNKEVTLFWNCPPDLPLMSTDVGKLTHIFQNLVDNAMKYTDQGTVAVSVRYLQDVDCMEFRIEDTGIGISEERLPFIFE